MKPHATMACSVFASMAIMAVASRVQAETFVVSVRDQHSAALAEAVISLTPASGGSDAKGARAKIDQLGLEFVPRVLAVQTGTAVSFPNNDQVRHHVYSFSPVRPFELRLYKDTPTEPVVFDRSGVATLGCNIHDWMIAYVVVVDTPYFATTSADGEVRFDVPPGEYDLRAWHARAEEAVSLAPQRIRITTSSPRYDIVRTVREPDPPRTPSELELKFRRHQNKHDAGAQL